jgi:hypothetical protein
MKTLTATLGCALCEWGLAVTWADPPPDIEAAVQAIQQAPDPSAAVSAYAGGFAADPNNIALHNAYVTRMVDFGLPELAYHQAQQLASLDARNGLAWGVVAHVDARRTDMPGAIAAMDLASQYAPEHPFVQRTAGEILAWYDARNAETFMNEACRAGIARTRARMENRPAFADAYNAARKAYAGPVTRTVPDATSPAPPPVYDLADLYSDWGPDWVDYWPWYWWWPCGFFHGRHFAPCHQACAFNCFHHHRFNDTCDAHGTWHHNATGKAVFYGATARPSSIVSTSSRAAFASRFAPASVAGPVNMAALPSTTANPGGAWGSRKVVTMGGDTVIYQGRDVGTAWMAASAAAAAATAAANTHAATAFYHLPPGTARGYTSMYAPDARDRFALPGASTSGGGDWHGIGYRGGNGNSGTSYGGGYYYGDSGGASHSGGGGSSGTGYHGGGSYSGGHHGGGSYGGGGHSGGGGWHGGGSHGGGSSGGGGGGGHGGGHR